MLVANGFIGIFSGWDLTTGFFGSEEVDAGVALWCIDNEAK